MGRHKAVPYVVGKPVAGLVPAESRAAEKYGWQRACN